MTRMFEMESDFSALPEFGGRQVLKQTLNSAEALYARVRTLVTRSPHFASFPSAADLNVRE